MRTRAATALGKTFDTVIMDAERTGSHSPSDRKEDHIRSETSTFTPTDSEALRTYRSECEQYCLGSRDLDPYHSRIPSRIVSFRVFVVASDGR